MKKILYQYKKVGFKILWVIPCFLCFGYHASADTNREEISPELEKQFEWQISGTVTQSDGEPIPGALVKLKGSSIGTVTDIDGNYILEVPEQPGVLVFSFIGFYPLERAFDGPGQLSVALQENVNDLDEFIVVGYSEQRKKDLTGAVSVVDVEKLNRQPSGLITNQLQGQASGVNVLGSGQPGQEPNVTIRGANTFGNNNPLYVVDGVPTTSIANLNPNDVESMQVLKDAGAASIYGSRAANGVIIITTRKGRGKVSIQYDAFYGMQVPRQGNVWHTLNPQEMAELKFMALRNSGETDINDPYYGSGPNPVLPDYLVPVGASEGSPEVDPSRYYVNPNYTDPAELGQFYRIVRANKEGTDWYNEIFNSAPTTSHNISMSGGTEEGSFLFSMNYFNQQGTIEHTGMERYTLRANSDYKIGKRVRIGENLGLTYSDNPVIGINNEGSPIGMAMRSQPIIPVHDIMGNYAGSFGHQIGPARNPVAMIDRARHNKSTSAQVMGNVFAEVDLIEGLMFRTSFGGTFNTFSSHSFNFPEYENAENPASNSYTENAGTGYNWTWTNTLQYNRTFNERHQLNVLAGTEAYDAFSRMVGGSTQDYYSFDPNYVSLPTGSGGRTNTSFRTAESLYSLIGRVDYSLDDKYLLGFTIRRDGSSKFMHNRYGWFPAISGGWRVSEEGFMPSISWLDDFKFRGGWGIMGNQLNVDPMNSFSTYASDRSLSYYDITGSNNSIVEGFFRNRIGNPNARWEKNIQANIGFDMSILKGQVQLSADYYRKDVQDLLFNPQLPGTAGTAIVPFINIASMTNRGFDFTLSGQKQISNDLSINGSLMFTSYDNRITKVSETSDYFELDGRRFGANIVRNEVGHPIGRFFGYKIEGFWNNQEEIDAANEMARAATGNPNAVYQNDMAVGRFRYTDMTGSGQVTADDRTTIGDPNPDFTYGLNLGVNYKKFDLSMLFFGSQGNDIWNNLLWWRDFYPAFHGAKSHTALYDSWRPDHMDAKAPIQETNASFSTNLVPNSYFVEDGSYFRLRNIQLGYTLPDFLMERMKLQSARIYIQGANLFTITNYSGIDPEIGGSAVSFGIDEGTYPSQRQFLVGVNLRF